MDIDDQVQNFGGKQKPSFLLCFHSYKKEGELRELLMPPVS